MFYAKWYMLHFYAEKSRGGKKTWGGQCCKQSDIYCIYIEKRVGEARKTWGGQCCKQSDICCISMQKRVGEARKSWGGKCCLESDICCISIQKRVGEARKTWGGNVEHKVIYATFLRDVSFFWSFKNYLLPRIKWL